MPRKIETGCYAVIRATGELVTVGKRYTLPGCAPLFATEQYGVSSGEYQASELRRVSADEFAQLEERAEFDMWKESGIF